MSTLALTDYSYILASNFVFASVLHFWINILMYHIFSTKLQFFEVFRHFYLCMFSFCEDPYRSGTDLNLTDVFQFFS